MQNTTFGTIPFSGGVPLTLAHLTFVRAFAQHSWVADEWLGGQARSINDWLSIGSRVDDSSEQDILVRVNEQAIAIADSPTVRAILPETPFVLALHGDGRKWNEQVLSIVLRQSMDDDQAGRLFSHRTIPVVLDRKCVERLLKKGNSADGLPQWLQVIRNELCRIPGMAASVDDDLLMSLLKLRRILPIADQWSQTPPGFRSALQAAVSAGDLPCLVVFDDEDLVADMDGVIWARSVNAPRIATRPEMTHSTPAQSAETQSAPARPAASELWETARLAVTTSSQPRTFDRSAVPLLVRSLNDSVADVRVAAAQTLGGLSDAARESVSPLITVLADPVSACRQAAANSLGAIGPAAAAATSRLAEAAIKDHRKVRAAACRALGAIGQPDAEVLNALVAAVRDNDAAVRMQAVRSLGGFGIEQPEIVSALKAALVDDSAEVRARAVAAISTMAGALDESVSELVAAVADSAAEVRREVVTAFGKTTRSRDAIIQTLAHSLIDPDSQTRSEAASSLARFGQKSRPAIPQLARLATDTETDVRRSAVEALAAIGVPSLEAVSALEEGTRDSDQAVRAVATAALERIMPAVAVA